MWERKIHIKRLIFCSRCQTFENLSGKYSDFPIFVEITLKLVKELKSKAILFYLKVRLTIIRWIYREENTSFPQPASTNWRKEIKLRRKASWVRAMERIRDCSHSNDLIKNIISGDFQYYEGPAPRDERLLIDWVAQSYIKCFILKGLYCHSRRYKRFIILCPGKKLSKTSVKPWKTANWLEGSVETGEERLRAVLLAVSMKLGSLALAQWIPLLLAMPPVHQDSSWQRLKCQSDI